MPSDIKNYGDTPKGDTSGIDSPPLKSPGPVGRASIQGHHVQLGKSELPDKATIPKWKGPVDYSTVPNPPRDAVGKGKEFTHAHKTRLREHNRKMNGGLLRSDLDGTVLHKPIKGSGDNLQAEVDHKIPQEKMGLNTSDNAQVLSKAQNREKWDH